MHQLHRTVDIISSYLKKKKQFCQFCTAVFLDMSQAFDRVWHGGLFYKPKKFLLDPYFFLIKSYLSNRSFTVHLNNTYSTHQNIRAGVSQESDITPFLYLIFTHGISKTFYTSLGTYAHNTLITVFHENHIITSETIQNRLNMISLWANSWKIKINETKSVQVTFSL
jgi:hypothetical protein